MAKGGPKEALWRSHADVDRPRYGSGKEVTPILATKIVSFYAFAEAEGCKQVPRTWQQPAEPSRVVGGGGGAGEGIPPQGWGERFWKQDAGSSRFEAGGLGGFVSFVFGNREMALGPACLEGMPICSQ